jgi:hypothetical protein
LLLLFCWLGLIVSFQALEKNTEGNIGPSGAGDCGRHTEARAVKFSRCLSHRG